MVEEQNQSEGFNLSSAENESLEEVQPHYGHRKSLWHRLKRNVKASKLHRKYLMIVGCAVVVGVILMAIIVHVALQNNHETVIASTRQNNVGSGYRNVVYKGQRYRYNSRVTSILFIGLDSIGPLKPRVSYGRSARSDSMNLVVMDEYHDRVTIMAINRNTIGDVHRFTVYGHDRGAIKDQLCLSYAYGENGTDSCRNVCQAVSDLLYGIPVKEYVTINRTSMKEIGDVIGDVNVIIPNEDLAKDGFHTGDKAVITSKYMERFLRHRDVNLEFSNAGRMERQKAYINGAVDQIMQLLKDKPVMVWKKVEAIQDCLQTNITRSRYIDLTNILSKMVYGDQSYCSLDGEYVMGSQYEEFYVDEQKLLDQVIEIFYLPD